MSEELQPPEGSLPPEFVELMKALFGDQAEPTLEAMRLGGFDPSLVLSASGLPPDATTYSLIGDQLKRLMSSADAGEVINWEVAQDTARQVSAAAGPDPVIHGSDTTKVAAAIHLADLWLSEVIQFAPTGGAVMAISAAQWIEHTWQRWQAVTTPIAKSTTEAMSTLLAQQGLEHPGLSDTLQGAATVFRSVAGGLFAVQIGHAIGGISRDVFGLSDTGLAMGPPRAMAQVPHTVANFAEELELPLEEVQLFLAAREVAHARLFAAVPWLTDHLFGAVEAYAAEITIDMDTLESQMRELDLSNPEAVRQALSSGVFAPAVSSSQRSALTRLETALALVEGWVDVVTAAATEDRLPASGALREMVRRRRAVGGPAEQTFATLVGLELRPRQAREATKLWSHVTAAQGSAGREQLWAHPDFLPTHEDLDEPDSFLARQAERQSRDAAVDAEIAAFLENPEGGNAESPGHHPEGGDAESPGHHPEGGNAESPTKEPPPG